MSLLRRIIHLVLLLALVVPAAVSPASDAHAQDGAWAVESIAPLEHLVPLASQRVVVSPNAARVAAIEAEMAEIARAMARCDALLVIGTSAQVHPAAGLPEQVHRRGGLIYEFNLGPTDLTRGQVGYWGCGAVSSDWLFQGPATVTVPLVVDEVVGGE